METTPTINIKSANKVLVETLPIGAYLLYKDELYIKDDNLGCINLSSGKFWNEFQSHDVEVIPIKSISIDVII